MVDGEAAVEELPSSIPNGSPSEPASTAEPSAEDREKASEWRMKGNQEFKSAFRG